MGDVNSAEKVKLSEYALPGDAREVPVLFHQAMREAYARYEFQYGVGARPDEDEAVSLEQRSTIRWMLELDSFAPDFAIFGPYGNREAAQTKIFGFLFTPAGQRQVTFLGPACYESREASWKVFELAIFMLDQVTRELWRDIPKRFASIHWVMVRSFGH